MTTFTSLATVQADLGGTITTAENTWLTNAIVSVGDAMEAITFPRFLWTRGSATYYFDASDNPRYLDVPMGIQSLSSFGVAYIDQPDDGSGSYSSVPTSRILLDPPAQSRPPGYPATRITFMATAGVAMPTYGRRTIKAVGTWGPASTPTRAEQLGRNAIVRAFRAKASGGADYTIIGVDGGTKILRDFAPAELNEFYGYFAVGGGVLG